MAARLRIAIAIGEGLLNLVALALLAAGGWWLYQEFTWGAWDRDAEPRWAFEHGSLGLEFAPLKYVLVMGEVSGANFAPHGGDGDDWPATFGFLARPESGAGKACVENAAEVLPVGFSVSNLLPASATPVPTQFVGLTCAACHTGEISTADGRASGLIVGAGNANLDVIAWSDAFRAAILDPSLTAKDILEAYGKRQCDAPDRLQALFDWFFIKLWLGVTRAALLDGVTKYDLPFEHAALKTNAIPAGPGRTQPFRSVVREVLDLPGAGNYAYSKIPGVFEQGQRLRAQFDGSLADPVARSLIAARASGASVEALSKPMIESHVRKAAEFTLGLAIDADTIAYDELFPDNIDLGAAVPGLAIYQEHCMSCHGYRPLEAGAQRGRWVDEGDKLGAISWLDGRDATRPIGTDPERVTFRYNDLVASALYVEFPAAPAARQAQVDELDGRLEDATGESLGGEAGFWAAMIDRFDDRRRRYPAGHPLTFARADITDDQGYINNPIPFAYLRAPFLHNGSVPTLAQLIHLEPRPTYFCRGNDRFDPDAVGLAVAEVRADQPCRAPGTFKFDTTRPGNSNLGHDWPWPPPPAGTPWSADRRRALSDLLEYLKTL